MMPDVQAAFINKVTPESYASVRSILESTMDLEIKYRVCEMPIFVSQEFRRQLEESAAAIVEECVTPQMIERTEQTLADRYRVPNESPRPLFSVVDFAVTQNEQGDFEPKLIELQGFPSLFGYQFLYAETMRSRYDLLDMRSTFSNLTQGNYLDILRRSVFADIDPAEVALVEIDPADQKTRTDFVCMQNLIGLRTVNIRDVYQRGNALVHRSEHGREIPLRRVFNRAIIDELDDMNVDLHFRWNELTDVDWAGHPNWYFRMSKYVMPWLHHQSVPTTATLDTFDEMPADLSNWVLKPLYAFAGKGVNVSPTHDDIASIPTHEQPNWILQKKVTYAPCIATPFGPNRVEIRVMLIWEDSSPRPLPVMSLARTGRGAMMGARYNTEPWTGSSGCLFA